MAVFALLLWLAAIVVATWVGNTKQRPVLGVALGILLSWIGVIIMAVIPAKSTPQIRQ